MEFEEYIDAEDFEFQMWNPKNITKGDTIEDQGWDFREKDHVGILIIYENVTTHDVDISGSNEKFQNDEVQNKEVELGVNKDKGDMVYTNVDEGEALNDSVDNS